MSPTSPAAATERTFRLGRGLVAVAAVAGVAALAAAVPAHAQTSIVQCQPFANATKLITCDLCEIFKMLNTIFSIAAGGLVGFGVLAMIVGGFRYITSAGNPELVAKAKKTIQFAVGGIIVATLGFVIIKSVTTILGYSGDPFSSLSCTLPEPKSGTTGANTPPSPRPGQQPTGPGSTGQWSSLINQAAQKYSIEPCALQSIMQAESGGNANALGHDGHNGKDDPYDASKPPFWNLNWRYSHGIGLMQPTIFPSYRYGGWQDSNTPSRLIGGHFYTVPELFDPATNVDAGAQLFKACLDKPNATYYSAFGCYNGSGSAAAQYAAKVNAAYEQCLNEGKTNPQTP